MLEFGILLNESVSKGISEPANGCFVASRAGTRSAGRTDGERTREKRKEETLQRASAR